MLRTIFLMVLGCLAVLVYAASHRSASPQTNPTRRVTNTPEERLNLNPFLSGDGNYIAFESNADIIGTGGSDGFRAFRGSLESEMVLFNEMGRARAICPAVSQNGSSIAFASKENPLGTNPDGNSEIFLFSEGHLRQVTDTVPDEIPLRHIQGNFQPSLTDDGDTIAFASNRNLTGQNSDGNLEIFIYATTVDAFTQVTSTSGMIGATDAKISGDGTRISYIRDNGTTPSAERDLILLDRKTGMNQVVESNVNSLSLAFGRAISDDGLRIVYASETAPNASQVFLYDGRNNLTRQLTFLGTRSDDVPLYPTISGDGKRVSFATRRNVVGGNSDNSVELYTLDLPTARFAKVTNAPASATAQVVSSLNDDGTLIAFNFPRVLSGAVTSSAFANNSEIYVAATELRPPFSLDLAVRNGASFGHEPAAYDAIAPDSVAVAFGGVLAFSAIEALPLADGSYPTVLGGTTVSVNGRPAQLFNVSPTVVSFHVPAATETTFAHITVTNSEGFETRGAVRVLAAAPGVFTETRDGLGAGVILEFGTGQSAPFDPTDGTRRLVINATGTRGLSSQLTVTIGGRPVPFESVTPSFVTPGLDLVRVQLPRDLRGAGNVSLSIHAGRRESNPVSLTIAGSHNRYVFVNEVLADPPDGTAGDANHDGVRSGSDDEFVELVNAEPDDVYVAGWLIRTRAIGSTNETTRHIFAAGSRLQPHDAFVIFGGGSFDPDHPAFGGAQVIKTSSAGLSLTNSGLTIIVRDAVGRLITEFAYGGATGLDGNANQSLTRSPDIAGDFVLHTQASGASGRVFSPGTLLNGTFFVPREGILTGINLVPTSINKLEGERFSITARGTDQFGRAMRNAAITFQLSNPVVAIIESIRVDRRFSTTTATLRCLETGTSEIRATATDSLRTVSSAPSTLNVSPAPPVITRVEVSPNVVSVNRGGTQQFSAVAFDSNNQVVPGIVFQWSSSNPVSGTVDQSGLAHGSGLGRTEIRASVADGIGGSISGESTLVVQIPLVINEVLADVPPDNPLTPDVEGDANRDGLRNSAEDEFVELLNNSAQPVDVSGVVIADSTSNRYTFQQGTIIPSGRGVIVFGGGNPRGSDPAFGSSMIFTASSLGLNDSGDEVRVKLPVAGTDITIASVAFGMGTSIPAPANQSLTRSPDAEINQSGGDFISHLNAVDANGRVFSSGTRTNGTPFGSPPIKWISIEPSIASVDLGGTQEFTAHAFVDGGGNEVELQFVSFVWESSDVSKSTLAPTTGATTTARGVATGTVTLRAHAGSQQATAVLTINPAPQVLTRIDVTPVTAAIIVGGTIQFTARGFDQNNMVIPGLVFDWQSSSPGIATISQTGLALGVSNGMTEISASSDQVISNTANLSVAFPQIPLTGQIIINEALVSFAAGSLPRTDFVELYNNTNQTLDISGLVVSYRASGATTNVSTVHLPGMVGSGTTLIGPLSYFLIANGPSTFGVNADFDASSSAFDINNSSGAIKIEIGGVKLDGLRYQQNGSGVPPVAFDGFGEGALFTFAGGTPNDLIRSPNAVDTDNNSNDFRRNNSHATVSPKAVNPTLP